MKKKSKNKKQDKGTTLLSYEHYFLQFTVNFIDYNLFEKKRNTFKPCKH